MTDYRSMVSPVDFAYVRAVLSLCTGIDAPLARHMSHLFIRDPLVVFSETIDQDDDVSNDHFEVRRACIWSLTRF